LLFLAYLLSLGGESVFEAVGIDSSKKSCLIKQQSAGCLLTKICHRLEFHEKPGEAFLRDRSFGSLATGS
jgi:hypothetical protein